MRHSSFCLLACCIGLGLGFVAGSASASLGSACVTLHPNWGDFSLENDEHLLARSKAKSFDDKGSMCAFATGLSEAQRIARKLRDSTKGQVEVKLLPGIHTLANTLLFTTEDSGVNWIAQGNGVTISGGRNVTGWTSCKSSPALMCAPATFANASLAQPRQLFVNGRRATRSIAPPSVTKAFASPVAVDTEKYVVDDASVANWKVPGNVEMVYSANGSPWTESRCVVSNVTKAKTGSLYFVYMKQPCFATVQAKPCGQSTHVPAHIENTGVDLGPGQWFFDSSTSPATIVYNPLPGERIVDAVMPVLERLVDAQRGFRDATFKGITWEYATWSRPNSNLGYVEQQSGALVNHPGTECVDYEWEPMPSNVVFNGTENVQMISNTFRRFGAGAVQFTGGAHNNLVFNSTFTDVSGTAIQLGAYNTFSIIDPAHQEIGNVFSENLINNVACEFHGNAGISVGYSKNTIIKNNDIGNLTYSGISIGWGWSREKQTYACNNSVLGNKIHDFKLQKSYPGAALGDGGGIYALGPQQNSIMKGNWVSNMGSGRGGGGFYPDEGSAYWKITENVFSNASFCQDDCQWLHIWTSSIHDINTTDCYTDTSTQDVAGTNTPVSRVVVPRGGPWPLAAQKIMQAAGRTNKVLTSN